MRKIKKICVLFTVMVLSISLSACTKEKEFDAAGYVKSSMDAIYHEDYKEYAGLLDISEKEAQEDMEKDFQESIRQQFTDDDNITEEGITAYAEKMRAVKQLAKYEVLNGEKSDDGNYTVKVKIEPSNVYQTLEESSQAVSQEKISQGLDASDPEVFASVLTESIQKSIDWNVYGEAVTIWVAVIKDDSNTYGLEEAELDKLFDALFPQ